MMLYEAIEMQIHTAMRIRDAYEHGMMDRTIALYHLRTLDMVDPEAFLDRRPPMVKPKKSIWQKLKETLRG